MAATPFSALSCGSSERWLCGRIFERSACMGFNMNKYMAAGTKVKVISPSDVPDWSEWDDDRGRTSAAVKKRLQSKFFRGDNKVTAEVMYISRESERERLRRKGQIKVKIRDQAGTSLAITADAKNLSKA
jgi:hypothetical protein